MAPRHAVHSHRFTSIKARILAILGALALGYLLLLAMVQATARATHRHMERVSTSLFPASIELHQAEDAFSQVGKDDKDAVTLEDRAALADAAKAGDEVRAALAAVRASVASAPDYAERVGSLQSRFAGINSTGQQTYAAMLASHGNFSDELQRRAGELAAEHKRFEDDLQTLDEALAQASREEFAAVDAASYRTGVIGWIVLLVALLGCAGAWRVLQTKAFDPLERLARRMRDIAEGDGDLTDRVEVHGRDELDEVGMWFNVFIERIEQIVIRVTENSRNLAEAARSLSETARETAHETAMQQEQAMRITSSMSDISTAVEDISKTTQLAARDASEAEKNAHSGGKTIHATVNTIQQLLSANQATATKIEELGTASQAVGKIVQMIDEIANQTSLLALNASIESARAGEHGRGFAVVAGEVRRLAERTSHATREIDKTVRAIQGGTAEVVEAMRSSLRQVEGGMLSARSAGDALTSIIRGSEAMQLMVTQIAGASSEQSAATHSVKANLNEIANIGARTTSSSARAVQACDRLAALAGDLNEVVGAFKVSSGHGSSALAQLHLG